MDLQRLAERARAATQNRPDAPDAVPPPETAPRRRRGRLTRLRLTMWAVALVALLAFLEIRVFRPRFGAKGRQAVSQAVAVPPGEAVSALGAEGLSLRGLREVTPAFLAPLSVLGPEAVSAQAAQKVVSQENRLPIEVENSIGMRFRLIPNGSFLMGSPAEETGRWDGEVQHVAVVDAPFYMGAFEVTQKQWRAVMGGNPSRFTGDSRPVEEVTWYQCQEFVRKLAEREGLAKWTYRLPTEVQWEYACRAGGGTAFHYGNDPAKLGGFDWVDVNSAGRPHPVGGLLPNGYGLHDLHGNLWEWCADPFRNYPGYTGKDQPAEALDGWRVIRGGNWYLPAVDCRSAARSRLSSTSHGNMLGFRVVRVIPELAAPAESAAE
ncbi:MAG: Iron(II)-dependent oxidoreductase EgtB [Lentisphaerae bacterium ADurb.BinA184]|nr:MAG: Iron(II)-dependent oxidoreductase EgtB [Lentisphaerae bacterium ADurb.BinA184]